MRGLKLMFALAGLLFLIRYVVVCYYTSEFNHFVTLEAQGRDRRVSSRGRCSTEPGTIRFPLKKPTSTSPHEMGCLVSW